MRLTLTYRVLSRLSLGIEVNPRADEIGPLFNWVAVTETERRPALIFGTSSDRIGTPDGQAYFATLSKDLESLTGVRLAPYVGVAYGTFENSLRRIGGVRVPLGRGFAGSALWDGKNLHPTAEYRFLERHVLTLLWVDTRHAGAAYSVAF